GFGGRGVEMAAAVPVLGLLDVHQAQVRLVDQGGGVERLARVFVGQLVRGQGAQLLVDQGQELGGRVRGALLQGGQEVGDVTHERAKEYTVPRRGIFPRRRRWSSLKS